MTKVARRAVASTASFRIANVSRRFTSAIAIAPNAPIEPDSVGVAMPRKIVPKTRNISPKGGTSANTARRASGS